MITTQPTFQARRTTPGQRGMTPGQRGMTLVEVLVAVVILSFALLAYLTVIQASDAALSDGNEFTVASQAAGDQIAQDQGLGYTGLISSSGTNTTTVPGLSGGQMTSVIGPLDGSSANTNILQVDITVTWSPRKAWKAPQTTSLKETMLVSKR